MTANERLIGCSAEVLQARINTTPDLLGALRGRPVLTPDGLIADYRKKTGRRTGGAMRTARLRKKALRAAARWESELVNDNHREFMRGILRNIRRVRLFDPAGDVARYNDERAARKADLIQAMEDLVSKRDFIAAEEERQARETMRRLDEMSIVDRGIALAGALSAKIELERPRKV